MEYCLRPYCLRRAKINPSVFDNLFANTAGSDRVAQLEKQVKSLKAELGDAERIIEIEQGKRKSLDRAAQFMHEHDASTIRGLRQQFREAQATIAEMTTEKAQSSATIRRLRAELNTSLKANWDLRKKDKIQKESPEWVYEDGLLVPVRAAGFSQDQDFGVDLWENDIQRMFKQAANNIRDQPFRDQSAIDRWLLKIGWQ